MQYITEQNPPNNSIYSNILSYKAPIKTTTNNMIRVTKKFFILVRFAFPQISSKNDNLNPA